MPICYVRPRAPEHLVFLSGYYNAGPVGLKMSLEAHKARVCQPVPILPLRVSLPLKERVIALKEKAESQPAKAPRYPDGMTEREVEVLRLIASGNTDQKIANELVISRRTVNNHVRSIFNKTAVANRAEAAAYATRQGLL